LTINLGNLYLSIISNALFARDRLNSSFCMQEQAEQRGQLYLMNSLDRIAQLLLVGIFLFAGLSKLFAFQWPPQVQAGPSWRGNGLPRGVAYSIALMEIAGALGLVVPLNLWQPDLLPKLAAAGLALLTLAAFSYHVRRKEPAAPMMALFLLTLFVIVGRWL
jgi:uncharacterized membrane protein YphA (DoxX/SURF4 family)